TLGGSRALASGPPPVRLRHEPTSFVESAAEMALANGGPQDVRRGLAGDREFLGKVLDIDRPPGRCIRRGVHEREIAGLEPSRVPEEVQAGDEEEESAQRRGRDTD